MPVVNIESVEHSAVEVGSARSFGVVFAVFFLLVGLYPLIGDASPRYWAIGIGVTFFAIALIAPQVLQPLNLLWFKIGLLLGRIVNPLVMFLIYVLSVVPVGLIMRALGKDLLNIRLDDSASTYWIVRTPPGPEPQTLEEQF